MRIFLIFSFLITGLSFLSAQPADTVFNQKDNLGRKQGFWKVTYDNGVIDYTAFFKDNKPVGIMKRYFDDRSLKAIMDFRPGSNKVYAKLYYQDGPMAAEGIFIHSQKDSLWKYYSYYSKALVSEENYVMGKKDGISRNYYSNGQVSEETLWNKGIRDGFWKQYFENGNLKMSTNFIQGKRNGTFVLNYPDGKPEWKGQYVDDKRDGTWEHFDENGNSDTRVVYINGVPANQDKLLDNETKTLNALEDLKGKIPEPDETNIMDSRQ